jgi:hypothetical protein
MKTTITPNIKLIETDSIFLEKTSNKILINGEEWYQPLWYKKISDGIFIQYQFEDLPNFIKNQTYNLTK